MRLIIDFKSMDANSRRGVFGRGGNSGIVYVAFLFSTVLAFFAPSFVRLFLIVASRLVAVLRDR
jgi:hypothetical protein